MIYIYDKALVQHLSQFFSNVICGDEDGDLSGDTKRLDFKERGIEMPFISIKRSMEYNRTSDYGGTSINPLIKTPIKMNSTFNYNNEDKAEAIKNKRIFENKGYNYNIMPLPIDLRYTLTLVGDNKEVVDNAFTDLMFILATERKLKLSSILSSKITKEDFYTFIEIDNASYEYNDKSTGTRFSYNIEVVITGAKLYYTEKRSVVLKAIVGTTAEKRGG